MNRKYYMGLSMSLIAGAMFVSCGGGGGSNDTSVSDNDTSTKNMMELGHYYTIHKGDTIVRESDSAQLSMETNLKTGETIVALLSGSAIIE